VARDKRGEKKELEERDHITDKKTTVRRKRQGRGQRIQFDKKLKKNQKGMK